MEKGGVMRGEVQRRSYLPRWKDSLAIATNRDSPNTSHTPLISTMSYVTSAKD